MSDWLSYRPSDFLMFAPRTYWRLFELHNSAWWPAQPLAVLAGLCWMVWLMGVPARRSASQLALRAGAAGLSAAWLFVGVAFVLDRYAAVNWAASGFAFGFVLQALGLTALVTRSDLRTVAPGPRRHIGLALCLWALLGHPLLALAFGRPWTQAEVFGLAPDPTAIATLGLLLCAAAQRRVTAWLLRVLWTLTVAWCAVSSATLWTLGSAQGWVLMGLTLVSLVAAWRWPQLAAKSWHSPASATGAGAYPSANPKEPL